MEAGKVWRVWRGWERGALLRLCGCAAVADLCAALSLAKTVSMPSNRSLLSLFAWRYFPQLSRREQAICTCAWEKVSTNCLSTPKIFSLLNSVNLVSSPR